MKRETISEAMKNISEDYVLEALELHGSEISDANEMSSKKTKKTILIIGLAAVLTGALGLSAYAALGGMNVRDAEPEETLVNKGLAEESETTDVSSEESEDAVVSEEETETTIASGENWYETEDHAIVIINKDGSEDYVDPPYLSSPDILSYDDENGFTYGNITKIITFNGPSECQEIRIKETDVPEGFELGFEEPYLVQGILKNGGRDPQGPQVSVFNIVVYYASRFGTDGCMFTNDEIFTESEEQVGDCIVYKMEGEDDFELPVAYYIMYNPIDGYIITISANTMELCEQLMSGLEIEKTGNIADAPFDPSFPNQLINNGVG